MRWYQYKLVQKLSLLILTACAGLPWSVTALGTFYPQWPAPPTQTITGKVVVIDHCMRWECDQQLQF